MFEFVTKTEYKPVREELENVITKVQKIIKKEYKFSFQFKLIGSGKRHLITRVSNGNAGYDFDYNLIITEVIAQKNEPKDIKKWFMLAFQKALSGTNYSPPEDSTSAFTIKVVDKMNKQIKHSCDFAIIYYKQNSMEQGHFYLKNNKNQRSYCFEFRSISKNIDEKIQEIIDYNESGWNNVRDEYLKLKNKNRDPNKRSFILYLEAVNNVHNQIVDS